MKTAIEDDVEKLAKIIDNLLSMYTDDAPVSYVKRDYKKYLHIQLPQQEISNEEIEKRVKEVGAMGDWYKMGYRDAIKWYREQLKNKQ
jgi:hypothetical protein